MKEFFAEQIKIWKKGGGEIANLPDAEHDAMIAKVSTIGDDLSKIEAGVERGRQGAVRVGGARK